MAVPAPVGGAGTVGLLSVFLSPKSQFLFLGADYPHFPQLLVMADFRVGELSVLAENDVETQGENSESRQYYSSYEYCRRH